MPAGDSPHYFGLRVVHSPSRQRSLCIARPRTLFAVRTFPPAEHIAHALLMIGWAAADGQLNVEVVVGTAATSGGIWGTE